MSDIYTELQGIAADILEEFNQGTITLTRTVQADSEPETPQTPGAETSTVYLLNGTARGVSARHVDGTLVLASDQIVVCSTRAKNLTTNATEFLDLDPSDISDMIGIDGKEHAIHKITRIPSAGVPVAYNIFVAS